MPTDNPKISLYVPQQIYDRFKEFQKEQGLSMSQAGIVILAEYFGIKETIKEITQGTTVGGVTLGEFEELKRKFSELEGKVNSIRFDNLQHDVVDNKKPVEQLEITSKPPKIKNQNINKILVDASKNFSPKLTGEQLELIEENKKVDSISNTLLAKRLGFKNPVSLSNKKNNLYKNNNPNADSEFYIWTQQKDFDGIGWKPIKQGKRVNYVPVGQLSSKLQSRLQQWITNNQ